MAAQNIQKTLSTIVLLKFYYIFKKSLIYIQLLNKLLLKKSLIHSKKVLLIAACAIAQQSLLGAILGIIKSILFVFFETMHMTVPFLRVCLQLRLTVEWYVILNPYEYPWILLTIPTDPLFDLARRLIPTRDGLILGLDISLLIAFRILYYIDKFCLYCIYSIGMSYL